MQSTPEAVAQHQRELVRTARSYLYVRERGRNGGPDVEHFQRTVGLRRGQPWCAAGLYAVCMETASELGGETQCPRTGSAIAIWQLAQQRGLLTYRAAHARQGLIYPEPGDLFVRVRLGKRDEVPAVYAGRRRKGHCGMVTGLRPSGRVVGTVEFNTNVAGDREGDGVYERELDLWMPELVGFVRLPPPSRPLHV